VDRTTQSWWRSAVFYQVYPRSFADSSADGVGDLGGVRDKLGYLELLGVDALWICPVMRSPMADGGYDVADPRDIDQLFGGLAAMDALIAEAHARRIRVTMDLVPNHTSDQHPWFRAALAAAPGSPERDRYIFRDGRGPGGAEPPNNWPSIFGGPAWTRITEPDGTPGQWYLHIFARPELVESRGRRRFRADAAVLARSRRGRVPDRCRTRHGQAGRLARHAPIERLGLARARRQRPAVQQSGRPRHPPPDPQGGRRVSGRGAHR
jgi:hypothetical protein